MGLFGNKEEKTLLKIEQHITEGINQLQKKLYNAALIEFSKAMELDVKVAYPKLLVVMEQAAESGEFESALSIGLNLIKANKKDFNLVNKLGNYARMQGDFKQASALYKKAYSINKQFKIAFYNLAASEVKADYYDEAVAQALTQFKAIKDYFLPSYAGSETFILEFEKRVMEAKSKGNVGKIKQLKVEYQEKKDNGDNVEAQTIKLEIDKVEKQGKGTIEEICQAFKKQMAAGDSFNNIQKYDFCIYALKNGQAGFTEELLSKVPVEDFPFVTLLQAVVSALKGKKEIAVEAFIKLLGDDTFNRYYNINLGLLYRKLGKSFLSIKYLLKTAELLKKTDGVFDIEQVIKLAEEERANGKAKKALSFYLIAVQERSDPNLWNTIGEINIELKHIDEAIVAFREILKIDPKSEKGNAQLKKISDYFITKGDSLMNENKNAPAADFYDRALMVMRLPETLKKAAGAYHRLNNIKTEKKLLAELEAMEKAIQDEEQEKLRQALMIKGKMLMKKKEYQKAIEVFDSAFDLKQDKGLYVQLAKLYKTFKGKDSVNSLAKRWNDMTIKKEREELKAREKEKDREIEDKENKKNKEDQ